MVYNGIMDFLQKKLVWISLNWCHGLQRTGPRWFGWVPSICGSVLDRLQFTVTCFRGKKPDLTEASNTIDKYRLRHMKSESKWNSWTGVGIQYSHWILTRFHPEFTWNAGLESKYSISTTFHPIYMECWTLSKIPTDSTGIEVLSTE